jgi:dTDP-4-dehydrorhamnose reductase
LLASRAIDLLERDIDGIFHVGGGEPISWFEFARLIFEKAGVTANLTPTNEREYRTAAKRPKYSALENARLRANGIGPMPPLAEAVADYLESRKRLL